MEIMKIGDKVRFLSEVGGGVVTGFRGKDIVLVEDADGFDIPMPVRECVVIETDDYNIPTPASKAAKKKRGGAIGCAYGFGSLEAGIFRFGLRTADRVYG